jgi:hypothetical protein
LRLNIEGPGASFHCLKRQDADLVRLQADPINPRRHQQTAEKTPERIGPHGSPEPLPPALVRAQRRKAGASLLTSPYGPLPILVAGLFAAIAYFATESSAPPPGAAADPKLATVGLEAIAPPVPALQNQMQPTERRDADPDFRASPTGETSSSASGSGSFTRRPEGPDGDIGAPKRAAGSLAAAKARSGAGPASRESSRAIHGSRRSGKINSARAQVPARKGLPRDDTKPRDGLSR